MVQQPSPESRESHQKMIPRYDIDNLGKENEHLQQVIDSRPQVKTALRELMQFDAGTWDHSVDVARSLTAFARARARLDGFTDAYIEAAALAALFHDYGKQLLGEEVKNIVTSPDPLKPHQRQLIQEHPRAAFDFVKGLARPVDDPLHDPILSEAANILVAHHEFQPGPYPRDPTKGDDRRQPNPQREKLQLYLTAFDQAVSLAQGGEGGHAYMGFNASAHDVRMRLVQDRNGDPTKYFNHIKNRVVYTLVQLGITQRAPSPVIRSPK